MAVQLPTVSNSQQMLAATLMRLCFVLDTDRMSFHKQEKGNESQVLHHVKSLEESPGKYSAG